MFTHIESFTPANVMAVFILSLAGLVLGYIWYSPRLMAQLWTDSALPKKKKQTTESCECSSKKMGWGFVTNFITLWILACFVKIMGHDSFEEGMKVGFWIWLGFNATSEFSAYIWENKSLKKCLIDSGFILVMFSLFGGILSIWQ